LRAYPWQNNIIYCFDTSLRRYFLFPFVPPRLVFLLVVSWLPSGSYFFITSLGTTYHRCRLFHSPSKVTTTPLRGELSNFPLIWILQATPWANLSKKNTRLVRIVSNSPMTIRLLLRKSHQFDCNLTLDDNCLQQKSASRKQNVLGLNTQIEFLLSARKLIDQISQTLIRKST